MNMIVAIDCSLLVKLYATRKTNGRDANGDGVRVHVLKESETKVEVCQETGDCGLVLPSIAYNQGAMRETDKAYE